LLHQPGDDTGLDFGHEWHFSDKADVAIERAKMTLVMHLPITSKGVVV